MSASVLNSPAVAFVGRHNSGKTTLVVKVIAALKDLGVDVGSVKHHGHAGFDIDIPGKDSWRHREAGANEVVICSPDRLALIRELDEEVEASVAINMMRKHDVVIVEGYRSCGLPSIEIMRAANERDMVAADEFVAMAGRGELFSYDRRRLGIDAERVPDGRTIGIATDIDAVARAAESIGIEAFSLDDEERIASFIVERFVEGGRHGIA